MKDLLSIDQLTKQSVDDLMQLALAFKHGRVTADLSHCTAAMLFYENSTRTFSSFQLAFNRLHLPCLPLQVAQSSVKKGETLLDTLRTLHAMGVNLFVVRHSESNVFDPIVPTLPDTAHFINAGDGQHEHPTQALLDLLTLAEHFSIPSLSELRIAIVGDLKHSRVAHSFQKLCALLNMQPLTFISPALWAPIQSVYGQWTDDLKAGLKGIQVIMTLRAQLERQSSASQLHLQSYYERYGITAQVLAAHPDAVILHPGPMNRGVEISSEVADGERSLILKQVENGIWMRMAVTASLLQA